MLAEHAGIKQMALSGIADLNDINEEICKRYPGIKGLNYIMALNNKVAQTNSPLEPDSVVAIMPPYSGG